VVKTLQVDEELMSLTYIRSALRTFEELQFFITWRSIISYKSANFNLYTSTYYEQQKLGFSCIFIYLMLV